ncbi:MAG: hypothetical protein LBG52_07585 [Candidatus Peribacteria bacterium]|nr:hypothetical protein [Candidatus Peribacteria bacterium]
MIVKIAHLLPDEREVFILYLTTMCNNNHHHDQLHHIRHSLSHIMAQAVQRVQQADVEIAI